MLSSKDIRLLQGCFLFNGESAEALSRRLKDAAFTLSGFTKGEIIFGEGDTHQLGILLSGSAFAHPSDGGCSRLKTFSAGEIFGAAGVFCDEGRPPLCKIEAASDCRVLYIKREGVEKILYENPERSIEYIRFLSGRVEFLNRRISTFTSPEVLSRVAKHLLSTADRNGICEGVNLSALAKSLDISRTSIYRARNELINLKAISVEQKRVTLLDRATLENII